MTSLQSQVISLLRGHPILYVERTLRARVGWLGENGFPDRELAAYSTKAFPWVGPRAKELRGTVAATAHDLRDVLPDPEAYQEAYEMLLRHVFGEMVPQDNDFPCARSPSC
jgi:hypothetical protein